MKFLEKESSAGVHPLSNSILEELKSKHPPAAEIQPYTLLHGPIVDMRPYTFEFITEQDILKSAMRTKGSAGPSGLDAEIFRRILCSKNFSAVGKGLREEIATLTRNLLTKNYHPLFLETYIVSRLLPIDKNPGVRPIGVGETLRRIIGKTITKVLDQEIKDSAGPLQTCAGQNAGAEAAIHAMRSVFEEEGTDAVLLIDASNAFNKMNREAAMHNIRITCPLLSIYIIAKTI